MTVAAILKHKGHEVITTHSGATVAEVVALLADHQIGAIVIVDDCAHVAGILSERDIVDCLARHGASTLTMLAGQLMTQKVHVANPRMTVEEAMRIITANRVRHLPVLDNGEVIGLVSIGDVVKAIITRQETEVVGLRAYIAGEA